MNISTYLYIFFKQIKVTCEVERRNKQEMNKERNKLVTNN